ncbi:MAG TPA: hypothetical protein VH639_04895 [Bryobacteraceae bacterium]
MPNTDSLSRRREPIHVVYGGAHLFRAETCRKLGELAARSLTDYAHDAGEFGEILGLARALAGTIHARVAEKLRREPVEDFRIDFEDGYGFRSDDEEDAAALSSAEETARGMAEGSLPPFFGIRVKPLNEECRRRSVRTLQLFLDRLFSLAEHAPENFVVTLPKIVVPQQVGELAEIIQAYPGVRMEMMIEAPRALMRIPELIEAARGLCSAAHFGPYDYSASLGLAAAPAQIPSHPACDFAKCLMQAHFSGTGIRVADGPTNILPLPVHRGAALSAAQSAENRESVHRGWKLHYRAVRHSLELGFYQGWDLHPAQLPVRFAASYAFFLEDLNLAGERLRNFIVAAARATQTAGIFDDAATGQGLLNYFLRAVNCGAVAEGEIPDLTGLTLDELRCASFAKILEGRHSKED